MPAFVVPGHKYLGPGNKLFAGKPTNEADKVARRHDFKYHISKNKKDVFKSDHDAIKDFAKVGGLSGNIGKIGLGLKNLVEEGILNRSLYPFHSG